MAEKMKRYKSSFNTFLKNRSRDYMQYGRYLVKDIQLEDLPLRLVSFMGDFIAMTFPILILDIIFLLVAGGLFSYNVFRFFSIVVNFAVMGSMLISNAILITMFKGQTLGKIAMNFKVVGEDNKEVDNKKLLIRQVVGIAIPVLILYIFLQLFGIIIFMVINGLCVVMDKKHRSIIDVVLKTKIVRLDDKGKKHDFVVEEEKKPEIVEAAENKYDLHTYSSFSHDGELEVEDLLKKAQLMGIQALSICDHNSVKANSIAEKLAPMYNIRYIPGINIDCDYKGHHVRILGYYINSNDDRFIQVEYENLAKEKAVSARRLQLFEEFTGLHVHRDKLLRYNRFQVITEEMIARDILSNPDYRKDKLLQPYLNGNKKNTPLHSFRKDFFGPGAPAYVPIVHPQATDMIALIHACGGVAVLAHPMYSLGNYKEDLIELLEGPLDGIEIFTPYHTTAQMKQIIPLAKQFKLEITAGSEYHGKKKADFILGKTRCPKDVEDVVLNFLNKFDKRAS